MIKFIASKGIKITIKYNSKIGYSAMYNPNNKSITIKDIKSFNSYAFVHELFHAYQDAFYKGGIAQYSLGKPGFCNIEFKCNLFMLNDISGGGWGTESRKIIKIMKSDIINNSDMLSQIQNETYNRSVIEFTNKLYEYKSISINNLKLDALIYLIKNQN